MDKENMDILVELLVDDLQRIIDQHIANTDLAPNGTCRECYSPIDIEGMCINPGCKWYTRKQIVLDLEVKDATKDTPLALSDGKHSG